MTKLKRGIEIAFVFITLLTALLLINPSSIAAAAISQPFSSFTDIPGLTDDEIAAIKLLQEKGTSLTYGMNHGIEAFEKDGDIGGFAVRFCQMMSELFGIQFELKLYEWDDLMRGLAHGEIDFTGDLAASEERRQNGYLMTGKIADRSLKYTQYVNSPSLADIAQQRKINFVFVTGAAMVSDVAALSYYDSNILYAKNHAEAYQMLISGEADAFFDKGVAEADYRLNYPLVTRNFFPITNIPLSLITKNTDMTPIISVMEKALQNEQFNRYLKSMYALGEKDFVKFRLNSMLTEGEREYIRNHPVIPFVAEHYNYPISFYNSYEKQWNGILFDVLAEIEELTDLSFQLINDRQTEWPDLVKMLELQDAYLISELLPSDERKGRFLWPKSALLTDYYALISKSDYPNITLNEVMNVTVGVTKGTAYEELFHIWFPNHKNVVIYDNPDDAFAAVSRGDIDMVMSSQRQLLALSNYLEMTGYKSNIIMDEPSESIIGFNKDQKELRSIFNKVFDIIDLDHMSTQWTQKSYDYEKKLVEAQRPWLIAASLLLFCVLTLVAVLFIITRKEGFRLEKLVAQRTIELEKQNKTVKETSSKLEVALIAAQAANKAKSNFLSNMSHEIRTPLNAITGMTRLGKDSTILEQKNYAFEKIQGASHHLLGVINDILDMSKIEAGKFELSNVPFHFDALIQQVVNVIHFRVEEKELNFTVSIDNEIPKMLIGDDQRLVQVITNLLSNAVKFTPKGQRIGLDAVLDKKDDDIYTLRISVSDTGIGISDEQKDRLFTSFEQAENDTTRKYGGTGLGLPISKHIIEKMGGKIGLESTLNQGSTFTITVPFKLSAEEFDPDTDNKPEDAAVVPIFENHRILLVEDVEINREIVASLLEPTRLQIDFASNGLEAVKMVSEASHPYELILMDIQMPEMDGFEATRTIRAINAPKVAELPIIAMTANVFKEDIEKCIDAGMNDHVGKPIDFDVLLIKLKQYLRV